jgi:hypothetical protein
LRVDIGGVDESPLWRIFMDLLNKRIETEITQLILPPPHSVNSATAGSTTMSVVGRWD